MGGKLVGFAGSGEGDKNFFRCDVDVSYIRIDFGAVIACGVSFFKDYVECHLVCLGLRL